jgi:exopolyphosphatase/guanosine-5'-triphosphate,3'-diphosphate pyrophosphatase
VRNIALEIPLRAFAVIGGGQGGALDELALDRGWQALARFGKKLRGFEAERAATVQFERIARRYRAMGWQQAIGSSGTARMLTKVLKANGLNDDGQSGITYGGLLRLSLRLLDVKHLKLAGLPTHRLSILPGGLVVMLAAFKVFGITHMIASEPGLRFGVLHGLMSKH